MEMLYTTCVDAIMFSSWISGSEFQPRGLFCGNIQQINLQGKQIVILSCYFSSYQWHCQKKKKCKSSVKRWPEVFWQHQLHHHHDDTINKQTPSTGGFTWLRQSSAVRKMKSWHSPAAVYLQTQHVTHLSLLGVEETEGRDNWGI